MEEIRFDMHVFPMVWPKEGMGWAKAFSPGFTSRKASQGRPTFVDEQVWPQASLLQDLAGGWRRGSHLSF